MQYRTLGKTGLKVSVIGIGTWQFGGEWGKDFNPAEVTAMLNRGKELGLNFIDTAECYGDHLSEALIGQAIEKNRAHWIIATKFGHKYNGFLDRSEPRTPSDVRQQLDDSLKALRTDYIDLYQYHSWGDDQFFNEDVNAELVKAKQAGKIRHIGNSVRGNSLPPGADHATQIEASTRLHVEAIQIIYNRLDRKPEEKWLAMCQAQNLGVLARVPLASGFLSGKYKPGKKFEDVRKAQKAEIVEQKIKQVEEIQRSEVPPGVDMAQWALSWCLRHPAITCVIPGCKNVAQVESNAAAASLVA
ncbi:MAG TPA: aldo/keto reductase [Tepidisphaeraceae bacterium]|jgi:aryl-alcohol dehydrogenase-like predicted oxidoreductase